jgi:hypothetical protein
MKVVIHNGSGATKAMAFITEADSENPSDFNNMDWQEDWLSPKEGKV